MDELWKDHIAGQCVGGNSDPIDVIDPATGLVLAQQAMADAGDVDAAVAAARAAHKAGTLPAMRPVERSRFLHAMARYIQDQAGEISTTLTLEQGKPYWEARYEVAGAVRFFEYYANLAESLTGQTIPLGAHYIDFTVQEPLGDTTHIIPWNSPFEMAARSLVPALANGNTCVVKTPELTPLYCAWLTRAAEAADLPEGTVNVICGHGHIAGAALAGHPDVDLVIFTGSVKTGIAVVDAAAANIVPTVLELGGKSAAIVYDDADLTLLENNIRLGVFYNAGQTCSAMSRLIVHRSVYDKVVDCAASGAKGLDPVTGIEAAEDGPTIGAMASLAQRDRAFEMVQQAAKDVAHLATGSALPDREGAYIVPTVVTDVSPDMAIAQEEVFGPVLCIIPFDTDEEAIRLANSTAFGLVGGVYTSNLDRTMTTALKLRGGQIFVNEWFAGGVETPFGGVGKSGYGREKGAEALLNYVRTKNIAIRRHT